MIQTRNVINSRRGARSNGRGRSGVAVVSSKAIVRRMLRKSAAAVMQDQVIYEYDLQESDAAIRTLEKLKVVAE